MSYQPQKHSQSDVKLELQEDWDNRDIAALISHNVKKISDFLCNFELSCKYTVLGDQKRYVKLIMRIRHFCSGGQIFKKQIKPIVSRNPEEAQDVLRDAIKRQFVRNAEIRDIRVVDILTNKAEVELKNLKEAWTPGNVLLNTLFEDHVEKKPTDFLSPFFPSYFSNSTMNSTVDNEEIKRFSNLSQTWWDEQGPMKLLHSFNSVRVPWIKDTVVLQFGKASSNINTSFGYKPLNGVKILDVGCGAGIMSESLARLGATVVGIDANSEGIALAKEHQRLAGLGENLKYFVCDVESVAQSVGESSFDAIVASEIIEHVNDQTLFINHCVDLVRSGGLLFFTTINKTIWSKIFAIFVAENVLRLVPKGIHEWNKFFSPQDLQLNLERRGCSVRMINGLMYNPLQNKWYWTKNINVNYALYANPISNFALFSFELYAILGFCDKKQSTNELLRELLNNMELAQKSTKRIGFKLSTPGKTKKPVEKIKKTAVEYAVEDVASNFGGDVEKTKSEIYNILHEGNVASQPKSVPFEQLEKLFSKMTFDESPTKSKVPYRKAERFTRQSSLSFPSSGMLEKLNLEKNSSARLNIFTKKEDPVTTEKPLLPVWKKLEQLSARSTALPRNGFEEMIQWTLEGKMFPYPIDNEYLWFEKEYPFYEHVFLEPLLEKGFPKDGPVRRFMELVVQGLSTNPYMTVQRKHEHIAWFRDYFSKKQKEIDRIIDKEKIRAVRSVLKQILNFNRPLTESVAHEPYWKVLIYDKAGMDILSPLISVKELRECGVTLHFQRQSLPEVPCIYFIMPIRESIDLLCKDLAGGMYESYYLNFISPLSRPLLEDVATVAVETNSVSQIQKVFDQYLSFISLEDDLFVLKKYTDENPLSFYGKLLCLLVFTYAYMKLNTKIRDSLLDGRNSLFTDEGLRSSLYSFQRPVLIICDRSLDLTTPLHHTWTYQALINEVLLNRVKLDANSANKAKELDINVNDKFWIAQKGNPFPTVAEAIQEELESYRAKEEDIRKLKHSMCRKLDVFFEAEEKIMNKQATERSVIDMIKDVECGSAEDKMRIALIKYLCTDMSENEVGQLMQALESIDCDVSAFKYLKRVKQFSSNATSDQYSGGGMKTVNMFSKLLSQSSQFIMEGVKNLVIPKRNLPLTGIVDAIMEMKNNPEVDGYLQFDPKLYKTSVAYAPQGQQQKSKTSFNDTIVFMIGGGTYAEYQNLVEYRKSRRIIYGCTELVNGCQFLSQCIT
ncbi:Sec1 family domain-containing protein 1 [Trichinella spiralis]|uniref:Ubiquinone biosynthesis O-methyltransferase, mitochondrial n=1 Tax=Trichinella spiralis TaxID=6334 RepID=A0A0V1BXC2_TRISP|nr:Sec1 family domain-containing protein 1 [Trichinella spiralis]